MSAIATSSKTVYRISTYRIYAKLMQLNKMYFLILRTLGSYLICAVFAPISFCQQAVVIALLVIFMNDPVAAAPRPHDTMAAPHVIVDAALGSALKSAVYINKGRQIAAISGGTVSIWDKKSLRLLKSIGGLSRVRSVKDLGEGNILIYGDNYAYVVETRTGVVLHQKALSEDWKSVFVVGEGPDFVACWSTCALLHNNLDISYRIDDYYNDYYIIGKNNVFGFVDKKSGTFSYLVSSKQDRNPTKVWARFSCLDRLSFNYSRSFFACLSPENGGYTIYNAQTFREIRHIDKHYDGNQKIVLSQDAIIALIVRPSSDLDPTGTPNRLAFVDSSTGVILKEWSERFYSETLLDDEGRIATLIDGTLTSYNQNGDEVGSHGFPMWDSAASGYPKYLDSFIGDAKRVDQEPPPIGQATHLQGTAWTPRDLHSTRNNKQYISLDPAFQMWNAATATMEIASVAFITGEWVVVTPEGFFDASPNGAKYLNLVRGLKAYSLGQAYQALYRPDLVRAKLAGDPEGKVKAAAAKLDLNKVVDSGAEPDVKFATTTGEAAGRTQDVAITVADAGGGIGKVEWRVNGVVQGLDEGAVARNTALDEDGDPRPSGRTVDLHRTLQLEPGDNRIEVVAYNAAGLIASEPAGITLTRKADQVAAEPKVETTPRLFVLTVGVNDYFDGRLRLAYAVPDAKALADGFKQAGAGLYSDVQVMTLLNQDVTMAKLDATFADLGTKMKPTDVFVFFIAGHGKTVDGHYHFIPYDFRYLNANSIVTDGIDQDHFQTWLARIPARKSLMLTDTCESGSLTEDPMRVASRGLETVEAQNAAIELLTRAVGRTVLSASTDDAPALEGYRGHGVFSYAVLDALAHAQAGTDGFITVTSLAGFVDQRVQDVSYKAFHIRQIPQMKVVGSNFPVAHRLTASLVEEDGASDQAATAASDGAAISGKPTHVLIAPVTVRATADAAGVAVTDLPPGTQVTLVQTANGWTIVARDGKKLGYVKNETLVRMQ